MKLYFSKYNEEEGCYPLKYHLEYMKENDIQEMTVYEAKRETKSEYFWCKEFGEIGAVGESCGSKICEKYVPNNGKNGRCKHYGYCFISTDKSKKLTLK